MPITAKRRAMPKAFQEILNFAAVSVSLLEQGRHTASF